MERDGIKLELKGTTFKADFVQLVGIALETAAKTILSLKTAGAAFAITSNSISGLFSAHKAIKREPTLQYSAWLLVSGGLVYALEQTIQTLAQKDPPRPESFKTLVANIASRLETRTYTLEPSFLADPTKIKILEDAAHETSAWLHTHGLSFVPSHVKTYLDTHFSTGLHRTWMKDVAQFEKIEKALNSPFAKQVSIQQAYQGYLQYIEEQFTEQRLIGQDEDDPNAVKLGQVFIPLRAFVVKQRKLTAAKSAIADIPSTAIDPPEQPTKNVVSLFPSLQEWIASATKTDAIRIISGGPGIGKSSSMRAFAVELARSSGAYPIIIHLQKLDRPDQPLRERIRGYFSDTKGLPINDSPLDIEGWPRKGRKIVLILDGLDELVRPGKDADEIARDFMIDLRALLDQENAQLTGSQASVLAIVTARIAAAGSAATALKCKPEHVFHLLRFSEISPRSRTPAVLASYVDPDGLLKEDQRLKWWDLYCRVAKNVPPKMPASLLDEDLFEVSRSPMRRASRA